MKCRYCGCTDFTACKTERGNCYWVSTKPPVCSNMTCVSLERIRQFIHRHVSGTGEVGPFGANVAYVSDAFEHLAQHTARHASTLTAMQVRLARAEGVASTTPAGIQETGMQTPYGDIQTDARARTEQLADFELVAVGRTARALKEISRELERAKTVGDVLRAQDLMVRLSGRRPATAPTDSSAPATTAANPIPEYRDDPIATRDVILLLGQAKDIDTSCLLERVTSWTPDQRKQVEAYAGAVHLRASDHEDVIVPPMPRVLENAFEDLQLPKNAEASATAGAESPEGAEPG